MLPKAHDCNATTAALSRRERGSLVLVRRPFALRVIFGDGVAYLGEAATNVDRSSCMSNDNCKCNPDGASIDTELVGLM